VVVAKWENELNTAKLAAELSGNGEVVLPAARQQA
jgi:hypothetical protein